MLRSKIHSMLVFKRRHSESIKRKDAFGRTAQRGQMVLEGSAQGWYPASCICSGTGAFWPGACLRAEGSLWPVQMAGEDI